MKTVCLIGKPNVGKSSLINEVLTRSLANEVNGANGRVRKM